MPLEIVSLHDPRVGSSAQVLAGFGFNCFSFRPVLGDGPVEVLWAAPGFEAGGEKPSHSGIPLLFPYPGRLAGQSLTYRGKQYALEGNDGRGNAIHGYLLNRPWQVVERTEARIVGRFASREVDPSLVDKWPAPFVVTVEYELAGNTLKNRIEIENCGTGPLPFGLGTHAYFRVPLGPGGDRDGTVVTVPVREQWELVDMLPSGRTQPATGRLGLAGGLPFGQTQFDDVFGGIGHAGGWAAATIHDPALGRTLTLRFDDTFRYAVVYNPPHREAICIEPYTCVPDYFRLAERGIEAGQRELAPGERAVARSEISVA